MIDNTDNKKLIPEKWVENYADILYNFAIKRVNNEDIAQDLVQETFLGGLKSKEGFDGNSSEKTWLFAILKYKIIDYYRDKSKRKSISLQGDEGEDLDYYFFEKNGHINNKTFPAERFELADDGLNNKEFYQVLNNCLDKIPSKLASVFKLKMLLEEKSEAICNVLNISDANYWVILHRAKLQLRACMHHNWRR